MKIIEEIEVLPFGAQFYRADLHIHSYQASYDVKDTSMTPESIIDTAASEQLSIIAITDHNDISNVPSALKATTNSNVVVIPGVELSTPEGHLLVYFPELELLSSFFGKLDIVDKNTPDSRCRN
jgi:DNA polymerase III alpha subunit (gram-positive type)